jgi:starch synthase
MNEPRAIALPTIMGEVPTVVHVSAEYFPYARTGGLAEAAWGLHRFQDRGGLQTMAIVPLYRTARQHLRQLEPVGEPFMLRFGAREETFRLWQDLDPASETPTCFIEHDGFFDRAGIYGESGRDYPDNHRRFGAFAAAAVAALPRISSGPVLLHVHDWHAALAPVYLRHWWGGDPYFDRIPVVMSVHNGGYQGHFGPEVMPDLGLPWELYRPDALEWYGKTNFLKGGLMLVDMATTVSPAHAIELRTPAGGFGLQEVYQWLGERFTGILNGIDLAVWDPMRDTHTAARYSRSDLSGKAACKAEMQRRFGLPVDAQIPVVALAGRMVTQKGLDLVVHNHALFQMPAQFIFLGSGEQKFEDAFARLRNAMPHRIAVEGAFSDELEHLLMAGADLFLMPSQYEPCGLTQMRAQHYGTIPVARRVGGLADTIEDGVSGFLFDAFEDRAVLGGMWRAMTEHGSASAWREMQQAAMTRDFGWARVAQKYGELYAQAIAHRAGRPR